MENLDTGWMGRTPPRHGTKWRGVSGEKQQRMVETSPPRRLGEEKCCHAGRGTVTLKGSREWGRGYLQGCGGSEENMPGIPLTHLPPRCLLGPWAWSSFLQGNLCSHGSWGCEREWGRGSAESDGKGSLGVRESGQHPPITQPGESTECPGLILCTQRLEALQGPLHLH